MDIKEFMAQDHDRLAEILRNYFKVRNKNVSQARTLFDDFKTGVERHMACEEEFLLPSIESRTGLHMPGPSAPIRAQHRQTKELLEKISAPGDPQGIEEAERELIHRLALHSEEEERVLYPWIDTCLCRGEKDEAINQIKQFLAEKAPREAEAGPIRSFPAGGSVSKAR